MDAESKVIFHWILQTAPVMFSARAYLTFLVDDKGRDARAKSQQGLM